MATLTNTKIKDTYKSLLKVSDNGNLEAGLQEITDGEGNASGVQLNTSGDLTASGTVAFGSLKDSGENITITKLVDEADGIASNDNDTTIPTSAAVKDYVDTKVTAEDLDFAGDSGTGAVDLDSQILTIEGTANEVVTSASGQTLTIGLPSTINVDVQGALTGNVTGNVSGNVTGNVTGNVSGDLTGNVTATSVLANGVVATTQASSDNSTKVATTAFVKSVVTAEDLDFGGDSGTGSVDLDSQTLTIAGTANEIVTSAAGQTLTVGLPSSITVDVVGNLTGNVSGNVTGDVTGNADTATALETSRTIALSGDVVASGSFDGSANLTLSATIQPNSVALGTDTTGDYVSNLGAGTGVTIANNTGEGSNPTITVNYGSTANTSVEGDTALTIQGTTNEIEVSGGAVTLGSGGTVTVGLPDNVIIAGDLTVNGTTTTVNTQTLSVKDPLIELANQNLSNSVDTGFFADYSLDAGVTIKYSGLFKDASDSDKFKLFKGLEVEPATTVDVLGTGYTKGDLVVNDLDAVTISGTLTGNVTGDLTGNVTATSVLANGVIATTQTIGDNSTKVATTAYVDAAITAEDLDFAGDTGTGAVDLDSQTFTISGTANEIETSASGQTITIGLPSSVTVGTLTATTLGGTLSTAAQTNITSVGTLSSLAVSGNLTVDTNTLFVDAANNRVGVGTTSTNTNNFLQVSKSLNDGVVASVENINTGTAAYAELQVRNSATNNTGAARLMALGSAYTTAGGFVQDSAVLASDIDLGGGLSVMTRANADIRFYTNGHTNERMRIDSSGRVGIGTTSPSAPLEVNVGLNSLKISGRDTYIDSTIDSANANIYVTQTGVGDFSQESGHLVLQARTQGTVYRDIIFAGGLSNGEALMTILGQGNVGIGVSPSAKLHVNGPAGNQIRYTSPNVTNIFGVTGTDEGTIGTITNHPLTFSTNGSERMRILSSGGLTFNGDTAAANALDDYEEGTYTPSYATSGGGESITYDSLRAGTYVKIGGLVYFNIMMRTDAFSGGSGNIYVSLPFTAGGGIQQVATAGEADGWTTDCPTSAYISSGANIAILQRVSGTGTTPITTANITNSSNSNLINLSGCYRV